MITLKVNNVDHKLDIPPATPLLSVLNEYIGLTGTKYSCGISECGACTILINGEPAFSCEMTAEDAVGDHITTIEGLKGTLADALGKAWIEEDVVQCGYCQPAQLLTAYALLKSNPNPSDDDIDADMSPVLCRCGTYQAIRKAIHLAAREYRNGK